MTATITTWGSVMRDMYPHPGTRIKQWVVDARRESRWEKETCPRVHVPMHLDNTGMECRNVGEARWSYLDHDCCHTCGDMMASAKDEPLIAAWIIERDARPPIEEDRDKVSEEIEPEWPKYTHPFLARKL